MEKAGVPQSNVSIAIIGMGAMGKGLFYQTFVTPGITCTAVSDINITKAIRFAEELGVNYIIVESASQLQSAISSNKLAITQNSLLLAEAEKVDLVIESSSSITEACQYCILALETGKHLVMMNAEADLIFGPYLLELAEKKKVVYTSIDGDQHGVIRHLIEQTRYWGFQLVMAGNIKGFLDRYSDPTKIIPEADKRNLDYKMAAAMADGTKLNIEMALLANAYGMETKIPGMYGPPARDVKEVFDLFDLNKLWNNKKPFVDYILGAQPDGGVFVVSHCDHPYQRAMMKYYKMGDGPFYIFYRPYHLCHVEGLEWVLNAVHKRESLLKPEHGFKSNVYSYAKKDLKKEEVLDGIGGYTCYGLIENCLENTDIPGLPICLTRDVRLKSAIKKDQKILMSDIVYDPERLDYQTFLSVAPI